MARVDAGFTLVETLIATAITIVAVAALAQLFVMSSTANVNAKATIVATILAQDKLEQLLVTKSRDREGTDFFDGRGAWIASGTSPPGWAYARHWSAEPLAAGSSLVVVTVIVSRSGAAGEAARVAGVRREGSSP